MDNLIAAYCLQRPTGARRERPGAEDRFYREHGRVGWPTRRLLPLIGVAGMVALAVDLSAR